MARFEDFNKREQRIIGEALERVQPVFFAPGHTREDRDALYALVKEVKSTASADGSMERSATRKPTREVTERPPLQPGEHTGFLYIECAHCDHVRAFCVKQPISTYKCEECSQRTPLIDMYHLSVQCECGAKFHYKTNIVTKQMDITCYRCGAPVAVEWSDKAQRYQPISYWHKVKKGGRK